MVSNKINFEPLSKDFKYRLIQDFIRPNIFRVPITVIATFSLSIIGVGFMYLIRDSIDQGSDNVGLVYILIAYSSAGLGVTYFAYKANISKIKWKNFREANNWQDLSIYNTSNNIIEDDLSPPGMRVGEYKVTDGLEGVINEQKFFLYDYNCKSGSGKNDNNYSVSIIAFKVPWNLPRMQIDSIRKKVGISQDFPNSEEVNLEGNFDKYFITRIQKNTQLDVLSLLSPDIMAKLINYASSYDIELSNGYIYHRGHSPPTGGATKTII